MSKPSEAIALFHEMKFAVVARLFFEATGE